MKESPSLELPDRPVMDRKMWRYLAAAIVLTVAGLILLFCGPKGHDSHIGAFIMGYLVVGVAVFIVLSLLYKSTGIRVGWLGVTWGFFDWMLLVFWPVAAVISLLLWCAEIFHLTSKRKDQLKREEVQKKATRFSHLSMDELLAEQRRVMDSMPGRK